MNKDKRINGQQQQQQSQVRNPLRAPFPAGIVVAVTAAASAFCLLPSELFIVRLSLLLVGCSFSTSCRPCLMPCTELGFVYGRGVGEREGRAMCLFAADQSAGR